MKDGDKLIKRFQDKLDQRIARAHRIVNKLAQWAIWSEAPHLIPDDVILDYRADNSVFLYYYHHRDYAEGLVKSLEGRRS